MPANPSIPLIVFAKVPELGKVKTRIAKDIGDQKALVIAEQLLEQTLCNCKQHWPGPVELHVWPSIDQIKLQALATKYDVLLKPQGIGDLGEKMHFAMEKAGYPAAIIGADMPHCSRTTLQSAHELLTQKQNVIGPTEDGGYYLIGLSAQCSAVFSNIEWGSPKVFDQTVAKNAIAFTRLESSFDIDTLDDYQRWRSTQD